MTGVRIIVVPDDDAAAPVSVPRHVLAELSAEVILFTARGMYVRASLWASLSREIDAAANAWARSAAPKGCA